MRILILHDEIRADSRADELDAMVQAKIIAEALHTLGHSTKTLAFDWNLEASRAAIAATLPDLVFNLVEAVHGLGRLIYLAPALLDAMHIPYTGADTEAMFLTSSKLLAKRVLRSHGIDTAPWFDPRDPQTFREFQPGRYIIKSVWEEASVGLDEDSVIDADNPRELEAEIARRSDSLGGEGFAEAYIDGREFNLSLLCGGENPDVLPPAEIDFVGYGPDKPKVVGYRAKWDESSYEFNNTPRRFDFVASDAPLIARLKDTARKCWHVLGLRGYVRVDFRIDVAGRPFVLELNANPCLSPDAGFAAALSRASIPFATAIKRIVGDAERTFLNALSSPAGSNTDLGLDPRAS